MAEGTPGGAGGESGRSAGEEGKRGTGWRREKKVTSRYLIGTDAKGESMRDESNPRAHAMPPSSSLLIHACNGHFVSSFSSSFSGHCSFSSSSSPFFFLFFLLIHAEAAHLLSLAYFPRLRSSSSRRVGEEGDTRGEGEGKMKRKKRYGKPQLTVGAW